MSAVWCSSLSVLCPADPHLQRPTVAIWLDRRDQIKWKRWKKRQKKWGEGGVGDRAGGRSKDVDKKENDIPPNWIASDTFPFQTRKWGKGVRVKWKIGIKTVNDRQSVHMKQCWTQQVSDYWLASSVPWEACLSLAWENNMKGCRLFCAGDLKAQWLSETLALSMAGALELSYMKQQGHVSSEEITNTYLRPYLHAPG